MINRSKVNKSEVSAQNPSKSGFNLSYDSYNDFTLGRVQVSGYQYVMPASKFSGHNKGDLMFHLIGTEFVAPIDATQFNVAVSLRSIDNSFEDAFAPSKNNSMSANWRTPTFTLRDKVKELLMALGLDDGSDAWPTWFAKVMTTASTSTNTLGDVLTAAEIGQLRNNLASLYFNSATTQLFEEHYLSDAVSDYYDYYIKPIVNMTEAATNFRQYRYLFFYYLLRPLFGEGSLLDELGYIILRNEDLSFLFIARGNNVTPIIVSAAAPSDFYAALDATPQCEYALRAYYAMWYQLLRDPNLEPVASTLPKWKQFGSTSVVTLPFFFHRFRSWYDDMFIGAQPDDMMRHVYAPIFYSTDLGDYSGNANVSQVSYPSSDFDYYDSEANPDNFSNQRNITSHRINWRDPISGGERFMDVPLPALVNDSLRSSDNNVEVYALDLFNLRQAQSLERYLKRNFYFGDEYKERMLAHYGSEISDYRLNYPTLLSSSINAANQDRLVNNTATDQAVAGQRNVNMTIQASGDGYESFAEEFTIVLNLISFNPRPQYQGVSGFNMLYRQTDFPIPEFAANNEELSRVAEIVCSGLEKDNNTIGKQTFGHHPYAHIWRSRVDEAHGTFRSSRSACLFTRYFSADDNDSATFPKLNYRFIHCRPNLAMFLNQVRLDGQLSGNVSHEFYVESPLPVPVESI